MTFEERVNLDLNREVDALASELGVSREHVIRMAADNLKAIRENAQKGWVDNLTEDTLITI